MADFSLSAYDAAVLTEDRPVAEWFEAAVAAGGEPKTIANWLINNLFALINESQQEIEAIRMTPEGLVALVRLVDEGAISHNTAKDVLVEMFNSGKAPQTIVDEKGLAQISSREALEIVVNKVLDENADQVRAYVQGKEQLSGWFVGQVMRETRGKANPQLTNELVADLLERRRGAL
jgi:aspartyl-tRNA(Asn)/glutamyl-tRNA(Gln) amidotransferase subunit B